MAGHSRASAGQGAAAGQSPRPASKPGPSRAPATLPAPQTRAQLQCHPHPTPALAPSSPRGTWFTQQLLQGTVFAVPPQQELVLHHFQGGHFSPPPKPPQMYQDDAGLGVYFFYSYRRPNLGLQPAWEWAWGPVEVSQSRHFPLLTPSWDSVRFPVSGKLYFPWVTDG